MLGRPQPQQATSGNPSKNPPPPTINTTASIASQKEEKEVIENLGCIFACLNTQTLKEIFTQTIDFIIEHTFNDKPFVNALYVINKLEPVDYNQT